MVLVVRTAPKVETVAPPAIATTVVEAAPATAAPASAPFVIPTTVLDTGAVTATPAVGPFVPSAPTVETVAPPVTARTATPATTAPTSAPIVIPTTASIYVQQGAVEYCIYNTGISLQFLGLRRYNSYLWDSTMYSIPVEGWVYTRLFTEACWG